MTTINMGWLFASSGGLMSESIDIKVEGMVVSVSISTSFRLPTLRFG